VIVGAEARFATEIPQLPRCWRSTGRISVDVARNPPVDHNEIWHLDYVPFRPSADSFRLWA
jgi:hypothetical protein